MARKINPKCLVCAKLTAAEAQALHGEEGDNCWNPKLCHRRRTHYRHRFDSNAKRRGQRAASKPSSEIELITAEITAPPVALLYLYKPDRKDAHLHAISLAIWQGENKLGCVEPVHTLGMTNSQVKHYLKQVLKKLTEKYGITEFEPPIIVPPQQCPIEPCPLKHP